jgi:hypothetical protein
MRKTLLFLVFAVAAGSAQAQIKCWNENGKRVCGDAPPAGAKVTTLKAPASGSAVSAAKEAGKDGAKDGGKAAKKGPMTPAEQEQDYRKRQAESQKSADKAAADRKAEEAKRENCEHAREALRVLESGQRIARTDAKGERYFLEDSQIAQESAKARQTAQEACK